MSALYSKSVSIILPFFLVVLSRVGFISKGENPSFSVKYGYVVVDEDN